MRLTLRTLLAYLDNTLDPQDAEILQSKLAESGFATQMVQRIRGLLTRSDLPAPSPLARGPVEEANVICEYLDSTLPVEQVAEVERACLDSDPHLAEAAACHQILTMVLDNPANVTVVLRDRIYQLPGEQKKSQKLGGSFSALAIPESVNSFDSPSSQVLSADVPPPPPQEPVRPVGVGDSGVMAAPARLRQRELADNQAANVGPAIAGSRPANRKADSSVYAGQIRPSRITPWLVTLGLAAVLLYALTQIFQPLLDSNNTADIGKPNDQAGAVDVDPTVDAVVPDAGNDERNMAGPNNVSEDASKSDEDSADSPAPVVVASGATAADDDGANTDASGGSEVGKSTPVMDQSTAAADTAADSNSGGAANVPVHSITPPLVPQPSVPQPSVPQPSVPQPSVPQPAAGESPASAEMEEKLAVEDGAPPPAMAKLISENALLAIDDEGEWQRLGKDAEVAVAQPLVVGPGFRATLAIPDAEITLIGPASARLFSSGNGSLGVHLASGRLLVSAAKPESSVEIQLGKETCSLGLATADTIAAVQLTHTREPGLDPLLAESHTPVRGLVAVQGAVTLDFKEVSQTLEPDSQWTQVGGGEPSVESLGEVPEWIAESDAGAEVLAATARNDLLELLDGAPSLEIGLRELLGFRRSEVVDLAARTLLALGQSDIYFGGAGIFNDPKQRAYWSQHYDALLSQVDSGVESASEVQQAIEKMDSAAGVQLFQMLTGYTDEQLASGSELDLLANLDSSDMSVRVLAFENLRRITGVTLNYRAEQDSQGRRLPYLKKWRVLQRKGEIRWKK
ncbi:hypothetical protein OAE21_01765 [Rubripirellula sp.]|nr:hypothetical protein [Rubripirellula sp.]MDB4624778.1 hypothetical protein [Rubripirellula sp.]